MLYLIKRTLAGDVAERTEVINLFAPSQGAPVPKSKRSPTLLVDAVEADTEVCEGATLYRVRFLDFEPFPFDETDYVLEVVRALGENDACDIPDGHLLVRPTKIEDVSEGDSILDDNDIYAPLVVEVASANPGPKMCVLEVPGSRVNPRITRWRKYGLFVVVAGSAEVAS